MVINDLKISLAPGDCYVCLTNKYKSANKKKNHFGQKLFHFNSLSVHMSAVKEKVSI